MKAKNREAFKTLAVRYKSVTLKEIDKAAIYLPFISHLNSITVANELTGFGCNATCTLCDRIDCLDCIYNHVKNLKQESNKCYKSINATTYNEIKDANNRKDLKKAFQARAKHMESILKQL